jgi:hypothetical protein
MMKNAVWVYITYTPLRTSLRQLNHEPFTDDRNIPTPAYPARIGCRPERGDRSVIWREAPWRLTSVAMRAKFFNVIYPRHLWKTGHEFGHCGQHLFYLDDDYPPLLTHSLPETIHDRLRREEVIIIIHRAFVSPPTLHHLITLPTTNSRLNHHSSLRNKKIVDSP